MEGKDLTTWAWLAAGLAAIGGYLRYYFTNKDKTKNLEWWIDAGTDIVASVFIGIVVFMASSPFIGGTAAAGLAGYAGHIGTRGLVLLIGRYIGKRP